jgi:acyl-homoserine lactone acylase PvdQ
LNAYADGINYYLFKHPQINPVLLTRFQPWYPLLWTDGSIGAINTAAITAADLRKFYSGDSASFSWVPRATDQQSGSNGFAIAPSKTESGNTLLYINPHTTFYFRPEVQMVSDEGLNAYGAVTWGQFFIYQGFNEHCGWMHTSANVDVSDMYEEKIIKKGGRHFYEYNRSLRPVKEKKLSIKYRKAGLLKTKIFNAYFTHHGPVMAISNGKWISLRSYNRSVTSLKQSWLRTKAKGFEDFKKLMDLRANTSNSTVFADSKGNIALWHGNFIPIRDKKWNWSKPVDGSIAATEWKGLHKVEETVHIYNPSNGWIQNCNSTPFSGAGSHSPKKENYPSYMAPDGENFRGINAVRVLGKQQKFNLDKLIAAGYDRYLSAFEILIPSLINAFEKLSSKDTLYELLKKPVALLKAWDYRVSEESIATTLAIEWAEKLNPLLQRVYINEREMDQVQITKQFADTAGLQQLLQPLQHVITVLISKWGKWQMPWGEINRFQRLSGDIVLKFDDRQPNLPVAFANSLWGMLPSYKSLYYPGTNKRYGNSGNSFVCAVEFGKRIKAKSLLAGGESGNPSSKHFNDQAERYTKGLFKDVLFYKEDIIKNQERSYNPGE